MDQMERLLLILDGEVEAFQHQMKQRGKDFDEQLIDANLQLWEVIEAFADVCKAREDEKPYYQHYFVGRMVKV